MLLLSIILFTFCRDSEQCLGYLLLSEVFTFQSFVSESCFSNISIPPMGVPMISKTGLAMKIRRSMFDSMLFSCGVSDQYVHY